MAKQLAATARHLAAIASTKHCNSLVVKVQSMFIDDHQGRHSEVSSSSGKASSDPFSRRSSSSSLQEHRENTEGAVEIYFHRSQDALGAGGIGVIGASQDGMALPSQERRDCTQHRTAGSSADAALQDSTAVASYATTIGAETPGGHRRSRARPNASGAAGQGRLWCVRPWQIKKKGWALMVRQIGGNF